MLATKSVEKITDASNVEEYYNSYLKSNDAKLVKRSKIITQQPKTIENSQKSHIKSVIEHLKISHKLFKTIRQAEKVSQVGACKNFISLLYKKVKKVKSFWMKKMQK